MEYFSTYQLVRLSSKVSKVIATYRRKKLRKLMRCKLSIAFEREFSAWIINK